MYNYGLTCLRAVEALKINVSNIDFGSLLVICGVSPAAGRASTSGSTSSGSSGSRMLPLASHAGACGALRSTPAGAALQDWPGTCAHTHPQHVPPRLLQQVTVAAHTARHIRRRCRRCCLIGESTRTESSRLSVERGQPAAAGASRECKCSEWCGESTTRAGDAPRASCSLPPCAAPAPPTHASTRSSTLHSFESVRCLYRHPYTQVNISLRKHVPYM